MILLLVLLSAFDLGSTAAVDCSKAFPGAGLTSKYNETIAHAIHGMTVQGLKMFSSKASDKNYVPTVNQDISKPNLVLDHAPDDPVTPGSFATHTMMVIDKILQHLGNNKDGLGPNWSAIERVAHVFHMWDLWFKIQQTEWKKVQEHPPSDGVCSCLVSVDYNGIKEAVHWVADHYKNGTPITLLNRPIPKLTDAKTWAVWRDRLLHYYTPDALKDAAMYLKCISQFW